MKNFGRLLFHLLVFAILTLLTQIGGLLYALVLIFYHPTRRRPLKQFIVYLAAYLLLSLWGIPQLAALTGRVELPHNEHIRARSTAYRLLNRHYVKPEVKTELEAVATALRAEESAAVLVYLDANFPFLDGFPLFPHLSHNDGNKVDLSFFYRDQFGKLSTDKPSRSGYGVFESPRLGEFNQTEICLKAGNTLYDKTSLLTLGVNRTELKFDPEFNALLLKLLSANAQTEKIFIEPHLKHRLGMTSDKIRFQGCHAVRHDDHIHWQTRN